MITGFFLQIFYTILEFFLNLLPVAPFPTEIGSAIAQTWGYIQAWSFLFPVSTLLAALGIAFTYHAAIFVWHLSHMVGGYIRGR